MYILETLYTYTINTLIKIWIRIHKETIDKLEETHKLKHGTNQNKTT